MSTPELQELLQVIEKYLAQFIQLKKHGIEVEGVITASEAIFDTVDAESGFAVIFQYATQDGQTLTGEYRTTIHYPDQTQWEAYARSRQIGAHLRVIYDAEALFDPLAIFADEEFSLDQNIVSLQNERQKILDFLEKQVFDIVDNNLPGNAKTLARPRREGMRRYLVAPRKRTAQETKELILGTIVLIVICIVAIFLFLR